MSVSRVVTGVETFAAWVVPPATAKGQKQPQLHTKFYQFIKDDVHHQLKSREGNPEGGLLCQDCHTTTSAHGNGNITGTLLANVEIFGVLIAVIVVLFLILYFGRRRRRT